MKSLIKIIACFLLCLTAVRLPAAELPVVQPNEVGLSAARLNQIDRIVREGIDREKMPGAVVLVARRGKIAFHRAYGFRQLKPRAVKMTPDTVFDLASITKPVATATSVMQLVESGHLQLEDPVAKHIPEFAVEGKETITVLQLLTHTSGLIPDNALRDYDAGADEAMKKVLALKTWIPPGSKFAYSDVGFIVLAELVRRKSGQPIDEYVQKNIFQPLGMQETTYNPPQAIRQRCAVTEKRNDAWMQGEVHDPRAFRMNGVAGHAGLFSTAKDLAIFGHALNSGGRHDAARILKPETVATMTRSWPVPRDANSGKTMLRGLGWDKRSSYSSNRGDLLSDAAFGHGGFTGTVLWMDPELDLVFVFLSNRVHPDGKGSVNALAGRIATVAAAAVVD